MRALRRRAKPATDGAESAARTLLSLAVLLQAGGSPQTAWRHLAEAGDTSAEAVHNRVEDGADLAQAIAAQAAVGGEAWTDAAAAWEISRAVGAPVAEGLRALSAALDDAQDTADDVRVALTEPVHTARLMTWLPLVGLLLGWALGFDTVQVLFTTPAGGVALGAGVALLLAGRRWTSRLIRAAQPPPGTPGIGAELVAIALSGGASATRALDLVQDAPGQERALDSVRQTLELSRAAGAPAVELLRATASQERRRARTEGRRRAAALSARMLLPLGACTLPAFLCLGVAPLMLSILADSPLGVLVG